MTDTSAGTVVVNEVIGRIRQVYLAEGQVKFDAIFWGPFDWGPEEDYVVFASDGTLVCRGRMTELGGFSVVDGAHVALTLGWTVSRRQEASELASRT